MVLSSTWSPTLVRTRSPDLCCRRDLASLGTREKRGKELLRFFQRQILARRLFYHSTRISNKGMGKLYGSEYWTYLLPKRVGATRARELTEALLLISTRTAHQIVLIDAAFEEDTASFSHHIRELA